MSKNSSVVYEEKSTYVEIKKHKSIPKIFIILFIVFVVLMGALIIWLLVRKNNGNIKTVKRVLKNKYYNIVCLDNNCNGIAAYSGNKNGKYSVTVVNGGEVIGSYSSKYNPESKTVSEPFAVAKKFFINKIVDTSKNVITGYTLLNKKGKELFKTNNNLAVLTDELAIMENDSEDSSSYSVLDSKGKIKINNVKDYNIYDNGELVSITVNGDVELIDTKGNIVLNGYTVYKEVRENDKTIYAIIKDTKSNSYYYFNTNKNKIVGDSFQSFKLLDDNTLEVQKEVNSKIVNYKVSINGKQSKIKSKTSQAEIASKLKKNIDTKKYNIYSIVIDKEDDKYIFADNLEEKSFGVYDIKNKKYSKLFDYKKDGGIASSTIYSINGENEKFYQVTCSSYYCDNSIFILYDIKNNKLLYKQVDDDKVIQNYTQYKNDYKVIKYSSSTGDSEYSGKYVLLDKDNKEIAKSNKEIIVVDQESIIKANTSSSALLYSTKTNKMLNDENNLANRIIIDEKTYYKYTSDNKTIVVNDKGKNVIKVSSNVEITYGDGVLMYIDNNKINMLNVRTGKNKKYSIKENEKMNDASGLLIPVNRGAVFINNSVNNYFKVVGLNGKTIKKISYSEINKVYTLKDGNVLIVTKNDSSTNITYGLYLAK